MVNVLIRDLPDSVHQVLKRRAERAGQSIQQYLVAELTRWTGQLTIQEWVEEVEREIANEPKVRIDFQTIVADIEEGRNSR